jgi:hypothetical protein
MLQLHLDLDRDLDRDLDCDLDRDLDRDLEVNLDLDTDLDRDRRRWFGDRASECVSCVFLPLSRFVSRSVSHSMLLPRDSVSSS